LEQPMPPRRTSRRPQQRRQPAPVRLPAPRALTSAGQTADDRKAEWAAKQALHDEWRRSIGLKPIKRSAPHVAPALAPAPVFAPAPAFEEMPLLLAAPPQLPSSTLVIGIIFGVPLICAAVAFEAAYSPLPISAAYLLPLGAILALLFTPIMSDDGEAEPAEGEVATRYAEAYEDEHAKAYEDVVAEELTLAVTDKRLKGAITTANALTQRAELLVDQVESVRGMAEEYLAKSLQLFMGAAALFQVNLGSLRGYAGDSRSCSAEPCLHELAAARRLWMGHCGSEARALRRDTQRGPECASRGPRAEAPCSGGGDDATVLDLACGRRGRALSTSIHPGERTGVHPSLVISVDHVLLVLAARAQRRRHHEPSRGTLCVRVVLERLCARRVPVAPLALDQ